MTPLEQGLLAVGKEHAVMYGHDGKELWRKAGSFRDPVCHDGVVVMLRHSVASWKGEADDSTLHGFNVATGSEQFVTKLDGLVRIRLRSITSTGDIWLLGEQYPSKPFSKPGKGKGNLSVMRTYGLDGSQLWQSPPCLLNNRAWRMATEIDGIFYLMGRRHDELGKDPRVKWTGGVNSVNIGCQLAASTPNYLLLKDHGGLNLDFKHIANPKGFTLGKSICGDQMIPAYGLSFITSQPCDCRGAGHWLRAGVPLSQDHPVQQLGLPKGDRRKKIAADYAPLMNEGGDPLLGRWRSHVATKDDRGSFSRRRRSQPAKPTAQTFPAGAMPSLIRGGPIPHPLARRLRQCMTEQWRRRTSEICPHPVKCIPQSARSVG